jgi:hypothetical protein
MTDISKEQFLAGGIKESNNYLQTIISAWSRRTKELNEINRLHKDLSRTILSDDTQETIKQKAEELDHSLDVVLHNRMLITPRDYGQRPVFNCLSSYLSVLIEDIRNHQSGETWTKAQSHRVILLLLKNRLYQASNIAVSPDDLICKSERILNSSSPPRWHFIFYIIVPISFLSLLFRFDYPIISQPNPNSPSNTSLCSQKISDNEHSLLESGTVNVSDVESEYFKKIETPYTLLKSSVDPSNLSAHDIAKTVDPSNLSAHDIAKTFEAFSKHSNRVNQPQNKYSNKNRNIIVNNLPWIRILANNERIDQIKENKNQGTVNIFNVLLVVPFASIQDTSLPAWSLGIFKGIDIAQSELIKSNSTNLIKVKIFDEDSVNSLEKVSKPILDIRTNPIVGIVGLGEDNLKYLYKNCPDNYMNIPAITSSIRVTQEATNGIPELSLLPTNHEIAKSILDEIIERRKLLDEPTQFLKPNKLIVIYDKSDSSSKDFKGSICELVQNKYKNDLPLCTDVEISSFDSKNNQDSLKFNENNNNELILAINPLIFKNKNKLEKLILDHILSFVKSKTKTGWMYVSPFFMDKLLEDELLERSCRQVENEHKVSCSHVERKFSLIRVAPLDWRTVTPDQNFLEKIKDPYGKQLNWSTINSYNNLMALHELINNAVNNYTGDNFDTQFYAKIRSEISDAIRKKIYEIKTLKGKIIVEQQDSRRIIRGSGSKIIATEIRILPRPHVGNKSE